MPMNSLINIFAKKKKKKNAALQLIKKTFCVCGTHLKCVYMQLQVKQSQVVGGSLKKAPKTTEREALNCIHLATGIQK